MFHRAGETSAFVNVFCRRLIRGEDVTMAMQKAKNRTTGLDPYLDLDPARLQTGGFAPEVLRAALFHVLNAGSFADALQSALDSYDIHQANTK